MTDGNPALNPTRQWRERPDTAVEVGMLVRALKYPGKEVLQVLTGSPGHIFTKEELVSLVGDTNVESVDSAISRVNRFSEAFGYVPLVQSSQDGYVIDSASAVVARRALTEESE